MKLNTLFVFLVVVLFTSLFGACQPKKETAENAEKTESAEKVIQKINDPAFEILDNEAYQIFDANAQLEVIDSGYIWTEGPLWLESTNQLLFNDIPANKTFAWSESEGTKVYLSPSGYTKTVARNGEPGANGLTLNMEGQLILCQHGDRRMALMNAPIEKPSSNFTTIIDHYKGKKLSSPNDATFSENGHLYFTDPPYGLGNPDDQETSFNGVYRYSKEGKLTVIDSSLTRPNGIAFSPDQKTLYVANSDPNRAIWMKYKIDDSSGTSSENAIFLMQPNIQKPKRIAGRFESQQAGYIFATGPGGVWVFNPDGKALARIKTGQATSNCAFGANQNVLYLTADDYIMRATFK